MDDRLKCSLCLDPFKDPRILTCFHSFCKECLQGYIANSETVRNDPDAVKFTCPVCRSENELPQSGVDGVQKNFYLPDTGLCPDHPMEDLRFYCRDCKEAICRDCKVVSHMTHTTDMVDKVADEMRHELETLLDKTKAEINEKENTLLENVKKDIEVFDNAHASMQRTRKAMKHEVNELFTDVVNKINFHNCSRQGILGLLEEDCVEPGSGLGHHRLARYKDALSYAVVNKQSHVVLELHKALCDSDNEINKMKELSLIVQCRLKANPPKMIVFAQRLQEAYEELAWKVEQLLDEFRGGDAMKSPMESSTVRLRYPSR